MGNKGEAQAHGCREGGEHHFHFPLSFPLKKKKKGRGAIGWKGREQTPEQYVSCRGGWREQRPPGGGGRLSGQCLQHQVPQEFLSAQLVVLLIHIHQQLDGFVAHSLLEGVCDKDTFKCL